MIFLFPFTCNSKEILNEHGHIFLFSITLFCLIVFPQVKIPEKTGGGFFTPPPLLVLEDMQYRYFMVPEKCMSGRSGIEFESTC
ncbi:hypothetical protein IC575_006113 [Cucumis melo]